MGDGIRGSTCLCCTPLSSNLLSRRCRGSIVAAIEPLGRGSRSHLHWNWPPLPACAALNWLRVVKVVKVVFVCSARAASPLCCPTPQRRVTRSVTPRSAAASPFHLDPEILAGPWTSGCMKGSGAVQQARPLNSGRLERVECCSWAWGAPERDLRRCDALARDQKTCAEAILVRSCQESDCRLSTWTWTWNCWRW
jgi:hypothetical protein